MDTSGSCGGFYCIVARVGEALADIELIKYSTVKDWKFRRIPYDLSGLSFEWWPPLSPPNAARLRVGHRRDGSVAVYPMREAISREIGGVAEHALRQVRNLRQPGAAKDFPGVCARATCAADADAGITGIAMRPLQA
jgi:hypothetical protein